MNMDKEFARIDFKDENALSELLSSSESTVREIRDSYVARLKRGEKLMAVIAGFPSCSLALERDQNARPLGEAAVDKLIAVPLS